MLNIWIMMRIGRCREKSQNQCHNKMKVTLLVGHLMMKGRDKQKKLTFLVGHLMMKRRDKQKKKLTFLVGHLMMKGRDKQKKLQQLFQKFSHKNQLNQNQLLSRSWFQTIVYNGSTAVVSAKHLKDF
jgi:hypothetical protein